ncbi:hypothetical protein [Clostridium sp. C8-1-8]|uniref:hypothetical protein n=1 Tax=Clostridium sp. C8-1-8 TaxID=2698831 RepID=UPI001367FD53|nr:hypothetical protein [Clostridium sp. C8-1-8]
MKKIIAALMLVVMSVILFGCDDDIKEPSTNEKVAVQWPEHMMLYSSGDDNTYYSITDESVRKTEALVQGNILGVNADKHILLYQDTDKKGYYLSRDEKNIKLSIKEQIKSCQISPDGEKILYSVEKEDGSVSYFLYDVEKNKSLELSDLMISGDMYFWKDKDSIIFYGIDGENKGGIFKYNLDTKKIESSLILKGFVEKFLQDKGSIVYILNKDDKRKTYLLDANTFKNKLVSDKIQSIGDMTYDGKDLYFTGIIKDNLYSLYKITMAQEKPLRLIYDLPSKVAENKKILKLGSKIILVGKDEDNNELVAKYNIPDKAIEILVDNIGQYDILF